MPLPGWRPTAEAATYSTPPRGPISEDQMAGWSSTSTSRTTRRAPMTRPGPVRWRLEETCWGVPYGPGRCAPRSDAQGAGHAGDRISGTRQVCACMTAIWHDGGMATRVFLLDD